MKNIILTDELLNFLADEYLAIKEKLNSENVITFYQYVEMKLNLNV